MALDAVVLLFLGAFAWLGAHRGGPESALRLFGLGFAYAAAVIAGKFAGAPLAAALGLAAWMGGVVSGAIGFAAAQALVELAARGVRRRREEDFSDASRVMGSLCSVARGGLLILPLLWLATFTEGVRQSGAAIELPDLSGSQVTRVTAALVGAGAERLAEGGDRADRVTARLLARPGASIAAMTEIAGDPRLRILQSDQGFWSDLENGDVAGALARPTFVDLSRDAQLRQRLADLGLVAENSALDAEQFHDEMAAVMTDVAPRLRELRNDPELQQLLEDPSLREKVASGDTVGLMLDPRIQAIVARVSR